MRLLALIALLLPTLALADVEPARTRINNRCVMYAMCDQQSALNECVDRYDAEEIVLEVGQFAHYTFYSTRSTAANYSCDIITNTLGFENKVNTGQVNTISITDEAPVYTMAVLLHSLWVTCPTITADEVNIDVVVCRIE